MEIGVTDAGEISHRQCLTLTQYTFVNSFPRSIDNTVQVDDIAGPECGNRFRACRQINVMGGEFVFGHAMLSRRI